jgi:fatty-acyl-CoA synthase
MTAREGAPHLRHWPKGVARELRVPRATLPDYLDWNAARYPDKPAIVYCGAVVTYGELKARVDAMAAYLAEELTVKPGDRVLLASQNCPQFVVAFYAILRAGAVVVPVNPMSKAAEIRYYAEDTGARVAFVAQELLENVPEGLFERVVVHAYSEAVGDEADLPEWVTAPLRELRSDCVASASVGKLALAHPTNGWEAAGTRARPTARDVVPPSPVGWARVPTDLAVLP